MSAHVLEFPTLGWVRGPYPVDAHDTVPLRPFEVVALRQRQRDAGIMVDGILGPQSWVAIASHAR